MQTQQNSLMLVLLLAAGTNCTMQSMQTSSSPSMLCNPCDTKSVSHKATESTTTLPQALVLDTKKSQEEPQQKTDLINNHLDEYEIWLSRKLKRTQIWALKQEVHKQHELLQTVEQLRKEIQNDSVKFEQMSKEIAELKDTVAKSAQENAEKTRRPSDTNSAMALSKAAREFVAQRRSLDASEAVTEPTTKVVAATKKELTSEEKEKTL